MTDHERNTDQKLTPGDAGGLSGVNSSLMPGRNDGGAVNTAASSNGADHRFELPDNPAMVRLKSRKQWVAWKYVLHEVEGQKPKKVAVNPRNGHNASHSNPKTWGSYEQALARARRDNLAGVGYVLTEDDDLTGFDLDDCRNPVTGAIEAWAARIIGFAESYCEISPSGKGLRIFADGKTEAPLKYDSAHVEIYRDKRFLTLTGQHVLNTPLDILPAPQTEAALRERVAEMRPAAIERPPRDPDAAQTTWQELNSAALENLDAWVTKLFPEAKKRRGTIGGYRVTSKSLCRNLQEDVSFTADGINDFGPGEDTDDPRDGKRTPIDMVIIGLRYRENPADFRDAAAWFYPNESKPYGGKDFIKAVQWLCGRLGREMPQEDDETWRDEINSIQDFDLEMLDDDNEAADADIDELPDDDVGQKTTEAKPRQSKDEQKPDEGRDKPTVKIASSKINHLNAMYAVLPIGGKTRVVKFGQLEEFPGRETIVMVQTLGDFASLMNKYRHSYTDRKNQPQEIGLGTHWLANRKRRQFDGGMAFMPMYNKKVVGNRLNLWNGYGVKPIKPDGKSGAAGCQLFLDFMCDVICGGNADHFAFLEKRESTIFQKRIRSEIALGLHTEAEGVGKGYYEGRMGHLLGNHAMQVTNPKHVIGAFNPHLETLLRLTADEALFVGNHEHRNALFGLITETKLSIEPKGYAVYSADNFLNISVVSNSAHFVPVSGTARRFFIPTLSTKHMQDFKYFKAIEDQLRNEGGFEALLYHFLYEVDLTDFNVRDVPKTAGLAEQAALGRRGIDGLVEEVCSTGRVPCEHYKWPGYTITSGREDTPATGFFVFIDRHRDRELAPMGGFKVIKRLVKEWDCTAAGAQRDPQNTNERISGLQWPRLAELRAKFIKKFGPQVWMHPESERTEWSTSGGASPTVAPAVSLQASPQARNQQGQNDDDLPF
jgi:hypothetical protein